MEPVVNGGMATNVYEHIPIRSTRCKVYGKDTDNGPSVPSAVHTVHTNILCEV